MPLTCHDLLALRNAQCREQGFAELQPRQIDHQGRQVPAGHRHLDLAIAGAEQRGDRVAGALERADATDGTSPLEGVGRRHQPRNVDILKLQVRFRPHLTVGDRNNIGIRQQAALADGEAERMDVDTTIDEVHPDDDIVQRNTAARDVLAFIVEVHIRPGQHRHLDRRVG